MPTALISGAGTLVANPDTTRVVAVIYMKLVATQNATTFQFQDSASNNLTPTMGPYTAGQECNADALPADQGRQQYHIAAAPGKDLKIANAAGDIVGWIVYDFVAAGTPGLPGIP